jgi:drug/metabolite transporter (DMT)-like permease
VTTTIVGIGLGLASIVVGVASQLALKQGMRRERVTRAGQLIRAIVSPLVVAGLGLAGASAVLWVAALQRLDLSYLYPFVALSQVAIILCSWWLFKEYIPRLRVVGIVVMCIGVLIVAVAGAPSSAQPGSATPPHRSPHVMAEVAP